MTDKPIHIATADKALLEAAAGKTDGLVEVTPDLFKKIMESLTARKADIAARYPELVKACPDEIRLAVTAWVFKAVCDHAREGGSFRYLIYDRLGFGPDAYTPLYMAGGMDISNEFSLPSPEKKD